MLFDSHYGGKSANNTCYYNYRLKSKSNTRRMENENKMPLNSRMAYEFSERIIWNLVTPAWTEDHVGYSDRDIAISSDFASMLSSMTMTVSWTM
jgi:hypothetical protein